MSGKTGVAQNLDRFSRLEKSEKPPEGRQPKDLGAFPTQSVRACSPYTVVRSSEWQAAVDSARTRCKRKASRDPNYLSAVDVDNLIRAAAFAEQIGCPLHHHLIIRWPYGNWKLHKDTQAALSKWLARHAGCPFYIWVKEANTCPHSHFLLHLPKNGYNGGHVHHFTRRTLQRLANLPKIETGAIRCTTVTWFGDPSENTAKRLFYLCKAGDATVQSLLGLTRNGYCPSGVGKRSGVSQSLGKTARKKGPGTW